MAKAKTSGFSYAVGDLIISLVGNKEPFNIDTIKKLNSIWLDIKTDDGEGSVAPQVKDHKTSGPLTYMQEKQGLKRETVVSLAVPKGEEDKYFQAIKKALGKAFTVSKLHSFQKPETKKASEDSDFKKLDKLQQEAQRLLREDKLEEAKKVQAQAKELFDKLYEVKTMGGKKSSVADRIATQHILASRIVKKSYMVLKVPVGYSFIHNAKSIISAHSGVAVEDEDLEAIIARFLDLVIFSLTKDPEHAGDTMPSTDQFFQIVDEVLQSSETRYGDDDEDEDDMDRYDDDDLEGDDDEDEDEGAEGRF